MKATDSKSNPGTANDSSTRFSGKEESGRSRAMPNTDRVSRFAIQPRLAVSSPHDSFEAEADSVASQVVQRISRSSTIPPSSGNTFSPGIQTRAPEEQKEQEKDPVKVQPKLQRKPIFESNAEPPDDDPPVNRKENAGAEASGSAGLEGRLGQSKGGGEPMAEPVSRSMSDAFGADFSGVRIHTGPEAVQMSNELNAQAFTHGNDIYFNQGKYNTGNQEGQQLLAHELTHTIQQGAVNGSSINRKASTPDIQRAGATGAAEAEAISSGVVDISSGQFAPSETIKAEIEKAGAKGLTVRVAVPNISEEGRIRIKVDKQGNYDAVGQQKGYMPVKNEWAAKIGGLYLRFTVKSNAVMGGFVSPSMKGGDPNDWLEKIKANAELLGGIGLKVGHLPKPVNKFEGNSFTLGVTEMKVEVGGWLDAGFNFTLENGAKPKVEASADVNVKGVVKGQLKMDNAGDKLKGEVSLGIDYKDFSGNVLVQYKEDGSIDIKGKGAYNANKLSGEVEFVSTDLKSANEFARDAIKAAGGKENVQNATPPEAAPPPKEGEKKRALAAVGKLQFNLTTWFAGTVNVIVDGKGDVTVIGKIAPPAEIELFKQKDFDKEIVHLQVEAGYGIPVVGTIGVFAGVILSAVAYIGPAKIYNIEILGTYSTDPEVQKSIQIAASLNVSAYAGLRLRAEGGAKLTILSHDLKIGVGVNADVGVKAYADARPTIGYRDPGEFFISGTAELVAQPMLGLSGDFFIELDAPWWSPIDDDKWVWPIGSKEWPLTDPIGLNAELKDYVLGSGKTPEIEFKKPEFDPGKFMTKMVDKQLPEKTGAGKGGDGKFKEDGTVPKPEVPDPKAKKGEGEAPPDKGGQAASKLKDEPKKTIPDAKAQQEAAALFKDGAKKLETIKGPITKAELQKKLDGIESGLNGLKYQIKLEGSQWVVTGSAKGITNKPYKVAAIVTDADKHEDGKKDPKKEIPGVKEDLIAQDKIIAKDGDISKEQAQQVANIVTGKHKSEIGSITVIDGGATWDYDYVQRALVKGEQKEKASSIKADTYYKSDKDIYLKIISVDDKYIVAKDIGNVKETKFGAEIFNKKVAEGFYKLITEADLAKVTPKQRFLPKSWGSGSDSVRPWLYESHGWAKKSADKKASDVKTIVKDVKAVQASKDPNRDSVWQSLKMQGKVLKDANIDNYDPDKVDYHTDHEPDLAIQWNGEGFKSNDSVRKGHVLDDKNLRVVTEEFNLGKGRTKYNMWVEPDFESNMVNSPKNAKVIKGEPFLDAPGGNAIK